MLRNVCLPKIICAAVILVSAAGGTAKGEISGKKFVIYAVKAISNKGILPDSNSIPGQITDTLSVVAASGEYEPASFVLRAEEDVEGITVEVDDLKSDRGEIIPSCNIDIRVVKCWYQDRGRNYQEETPAKTYNPLPLAHKKALVPELLLHDDYLIRVDTKERHNYLRTFENGQVKYLIISSEKEGEGVSGASAVPVNDSSHLLPVDIKKDSNKQFWITVKVPEQARAGAYCSKIKFKTKKGTAGSLNLKLRVLPFKLSKAYYISSIYYYRPDKRFHKSKVTEQFRKEMENLYAHGVTDVMCPSSGLLKEFLELRKKAGIDSKILFYRGVNPRNPTAPEALAKIRSDVKEVIEIVKPYGIEEVYFYGIDEALCIRKALGHKSAKDAIERFTSQRPAWEAVHEAGGKIFVAGVKANYYKDERKIGNFGFMGDIQDLMVAYGYPDKEEAARWHGRGGKIVCYANPEGGIEQAETYRRNFGLLLWQNDYDGAMTYIYHWQWGDFYRKAYKQHNMVYATVDGVIDTIQWEGYREGVDDIRYLTTLLDAIKKAEQCEDEKIQRVVSEAKDYLRKLKDNDINKTRKDLAAIRSEMIEYILALGDIEQEEKRVK